MTAEVLKLTPEKGAVVPINEDPTDVGRTYDYTPGYLGQQVVDVSTGNVYVAIGVTPSNWLLTAVGTGAVDSVFGRTGVVAAANGDYAGVVATHLTGATAATRYVGGTASGAPGSGAFLKGDFVIDQTGAVWVCTTAGSPGTWTEAGGGGSQPVFWGPKAVVTYLDLQAAFSGDGYVRLAGQPSTRPLITKGIWLRVTEEFAGDPTSDPTRGLYAAVVHGSGGSLEDINFDPEIPLKPPGTDNTTYPGITGAEVIGLCPGLTFTNAPTSVPFAYPVVLYDTGSVLAVAYSFDASQLTGGSLEAYPLYMVAPSDFTP